MQDEYDDDNDLVTEKSLKLVYTFESPTLVQGIWWSTAYPNGDNEGYLRGIKSLEFSFPASMGGASFESKAIPYKKKDHNAGHDDIGVLYFHQPVLTESLALSEFAFVTINKEPYVKNTLRFSLELFGCSDYQADISMTNIIFFHELSFKIQFISVNCPDGWFHNSGYCLKAIEDAAGFSENDIQDKCENVGGFVLAPMNEKYTKDVEDLLSSSTGLLGTEFWIGNEYK